MKPPCTRGLKEFADGCPKRPWDSETGEGCPLWIEQEVASRENPLVKKMRRQCVDRWQWDFQWAQLGLLEGNQAAVEQLRNGLLFYDDDNKTVSPKPDYAIRELVKMLKALHAKQIAELDYRQGDIKRLASGD